MCVNYRKLNYVTENVIYAMLRINDALAALSESKDFSTIYLLSGYQIEMESGDTAKTFFCYAVEAV